MKQCNVCKQLKSELEFSKDKATKNGLSRKCKSCCSKYNKKYEEEHYEERRKYHKRYYREHKEETLARTKKWNKEHPEKYKIYYKKALKKCKASRDQGLGWVELYPNPFAVCELIDAHHLDNIHVVYLPKDLHRLGGAYNGANVEFHRINLNYITDQIYKGV